jgi:membrane-associated phospholipid phosphatase
VTSVDQRAGVEKAGDEFADAVVASGPGPGRQRWWLEIPLAVAFYVAYAQIRDWHGSATVHDTKLARTHGFDLLHLERWLHIDWEHAAQHAFIYHLRPVVVAMDVYYGTLHFVLTLGVFLWLLFAAAPTVYRHARNVLMTGTAIGLIGFATFPALPPRLMPPGIKTRDTMESIGGLWSYNHGVLEHISDPFAPMPSLHIVWASWVAYVLWLQARGSRRWWVRLSPWLYPVLTALVVIVTGTHWVIDLVGGAVVFAAAVGVARLIDRLSLAAVRSRRGSSSR